MKTDDIRYHDFKDTKGDSCHSYSCRYCGTLTDFPDWVSCVHSCRAILERNLLTYTTHQGITSGPK